MRRRSPSLLALLLLLACSDSTAPESSSPGLEAGTYSMTLTACETCSDGSGSPFAVLFRDGVAAQLAVSNVTESDARVEFVELRASTGTDLLGTLAQRVVEFSRSLGAYAGTVGYVQGNIELTLSSDGCLFSLEYPGVSTGQGLCDLE